MGAEYADWSKKKITEKKHNIMKSTWGVHCSQILETM
jgi:hypothetical protein